MCILFSYKGDVESDYSLIIVTNRDEFYDRPAKNIGHWIEDPNVVGGRDLESECHGGTWFALSPLRQKIGVLLNLPRVKSPTAKTRGKIVADFVKSDIQPLDFVESMQSYFDACNDFIFVTVNIGVNPVIQSYSNATNRLDTWPDPCLGFSNSLPEAPLKKVQAGVTRLNEICSRLNKVQMKTQLIAELIAFLKWNERHLPDLELESRRPEIYKELSSVFVQIPKLRYGTRTHTIVLVTKTGHMDIVEISLQAPVDLSNPKWERTEFQYELRFSNL